MSKSHVVGRCSQSLARTPTSHTSSSHPTQPHCPTPHCNLVPMMHGRQEARPGLTVRTRLPLRSVDERRTPALVFCIRRAYLDMPQWLWWWAQIETDSVGGTLSAVAVQALPKLVLPSSHLISLSHSRTRQRDLNSTDPCGSSAG
jgi:hypothetical protein